MALLKPTITSCIDGREHSWLIVSIENDAEDAKWEHRWCQKCGALTQVVFTKEGEVIAVKNPDQSYYLMVPKVLAAVIK